MSEGTPESLPGLDALERLARSATPGPWRWGRGPSEVLLADGILAADGSAVFANCGRGAGDPSDEDAAFIAAAHPAAVLALVAELRAARAEAARLRQALQAIQGWDCLNPPDPQLCADHPWLQRLVDAALTAPPGAAPVPPPPADRGSSPRTPGSAG